MTRVWRPGDGQDDSNLPTILREAFYRDHLIIVEAYPLSEWHGGVFYTIGSEMGDVMVREYGPNGQEEQNMPLIAGTDGAQAALTMLQISAEIMFGGG